MPSTCQPAVGGRHGAFPSLLSLNSFDTGSGFSVEIILIVVRRKIDFSTRMIHHDPPTLFEFAKRERELAMRIIFFAL